MSQKLALDCIQMVWMDLQKNEKIAHFMVLFWAFLGQILAILRISDQKMTTHPFSKENRYASLANCPFDLKIGIQVLCNGSNKVTFSFFEIFIFRLFTGPKKAKNVKNQKKMPFRFWAKMAIFWHIWQNLDKISIF